MNNTETTGWAGDLNVARALTWRYVIALLLVASLSTAAWLSLQLVISEQESTAAVVNVSGRQRMLSQRTALLSNLLINSPRAERPAIRSKLSDAVLLMERSHHGLTHGDAEMGLPEEISPTVRSMYFDQPDALDEQVTTYLGNVRKLQLMSDDELDASAPLLQAITTTALNSLVVALDRMVHQYQLEGEASVGRLQKAETIFWGVTILLLMLEAALIFHPIVRHVQLIIGKLRHVTEELQIHQEDLEKTVQQRTQELESRSMALVESEEKFRLISTTAQDAIAFIDSEELVIYWNPAAEKIFGYTANEVLGKNLHNLLTPDHYRDAAHDGFEHFSNSGEGKLIGKTFEITARHKNGHEFPVELSISALRFQNSWHALGIIRDITERKQMEEQIRQLAFYDVLTDLPNRRLLADRMSHAMATSKRRSLHGALMLLDMDNFKPLNDTYGHDVGDLLLKEVARRLKECIRETDTVARFGGDEFVVLLNELDADKDAATAQAELVAEKIRNALALPYLLNIRQHEESSMTVAHRCTVSIGITLFTGSESAPDDILKYADLAMYQAKERGRNNFRFYTNSAA